MPPAKQKCWNREMVHYIIEVVNYSGRHALNLFWQCLDQNVYYFLYEKNKIKQRWLHSNREDMWYKLLNFLGLAKSWTIILSVDKLRSQSFVINYLCLPHNLRPIIDHQRLRHTLLGFKPDRPYRGWEFFFAERLINVSVWEKEY